MQLSQIHDIALKFLELHPLPELYKLIADETIKYAGADHCSIYLIEGKNLSKVYASTPELYKVVAKKNGMTYKTFQTHKVHIVDAQTIWADYPYLKEMGVKTSIFLPLSYQKKSIGVIVLQSLKVIRPTSEVINGLHIIGAMASLAIQKIYATERGERTSAALDYHKAMESVLENIYRSGLKFLIPLNLKQTYSTIVREAMKLVGADIGSIFLKTGSQLERVYATNAIMYKISPRKNGNLYKAFKGRNPILLTQKQIVSDHPEVKKLNIRSNILLPLINQSKTIGVLTLISTKKDTFTKEDINVLRLYSPLASLAIRKAQLYDEARRAIEVRDLFISIAAHELRTPLTTLNGYAHLLTRKFEKEKSQEARWVKNLSHEAHRLTQLVQDLLDVNRVQAGKLNYVWQECDIREIVKKAITNFRFSYPDTKIAFNNFLPQKKGSIIGDSIKLIQVFNNILNNAGKFSPPDSEVILTLSFVDDEYVIKVEDKGPGIPKTDQKKIFNLFFKGNENIKEGMGLGLYLARSIVEKHKGTINIVSEDGAGTVVTVSVPSAKL